MLKSTHKNAGLKASSSLPEGWTEHTAPSGHKYYYNASTKQSTYTRPALETAADPQDEEPLFAEEAAPDPIMLATLRMQEQFAHSTAQAQPGHFAGGKSYQQRPQRRGHGGDRPKRKKVIVDCEPWVLVYTKFGRRFVHNLETKKSLWKFPQEVMMAVIEMESKEWKAKSDQKEKATEKAAEPAKASNEPTAQTSAPADTHTNPEPGYDSSEYEEVEVTDDEAEGGSPASKRPRRSPSPSHQQPSAPSGPAEMTEDDIAWQLAQMDASDDDYDAAYDNLVDQNSDADAEADADDDPGLEITPADNLALFRSLLDETSTSPYTTFEALLVLPAYVDDPRWVSLPNMSSRRDAFATWSRDRVAEQKAAQASQAARPKNADDPQVAYLRFLSEKATPKLYWPEFKRKWKREGVMRGYELADKEREKVYRDFVARVKGKGAGERRRELGALLKGVQRGEGEEETEVPLEVLRDMRYWVVGEKEREEVVSAWLGSGK